MIQDLLIRNTSEQDGVTHARNVVMDERWIFLDEAPPLAARPTAHVSRRFVPSSSGMYRIRYLRVFDYVSVS